MNKPLLIAAVCAGLPACAAQNAPPAAPATASVAGHCGMPDHPPPASAALPARVSTGPEPQLGTVAPASRVPAHVMTPSMRAMQQASAAQAGEMAHVDKKTRKNCPMMPASEASKAGSEKLGGS